MTSMEGKKYYNRPNLVDIFDKFSVMSGSNQAPRICAVLPDKFYVEKTSRSSRDRTNVVSNQEAVSSDTAKRLISGATNGDKYKVNGEMRYGSKAHTDILKDGLLDESEIITYNDGVKKTFFESMIDNISSLINTYRLELGLSSALWGDYLNELVNAAKEHEQGALFVKIADVIKVILKGSEHSLHSDDCITYAFFLLVLTMLYPNADLYALKAFYDEGYVRDIITNGLYGKTGNSKSTYEAVEEITYAKLKRIFYPKISDGEEGSSIISNVSLLYELISPSSTTQSVNVFLSKVIDELEEGYDAEAIIHKFDELSKKLVIYNSEYQIISDTWSRVKISSVGGSITIGDVEKILAEFEMTKHFIKAAGLRNITSIANNATEVNILLPSVSTKAVDYLSGLLPTTMKKINIFISEARPKVPTNVNDTLVKLRDAIGKAMPFKSITVVPDSVALNLMSRGKISLVIYGASKILTTNGAPYWFTNSCGTESVMLIAREKQVPVHVVAEMNKYEEVEKDNEGNLKYFMNYEDEPGAFSADIKDSVWDFEKRNVRRDFSVLHKGVILVSEEKAYDDIKDEAPPIVVENSQDATEVVYK